MAVTYTSTLGKARQLYEAAATIRAVKPTKKLAGSFSGRLKGEGYESWIRRRVAQEIRSRQWILNITHRRAIAVGYECPIHGYVLEETDYSPTEQGKPLHYECAQCWIEAMAFQLDCRRWWRRTVMRLPHIIGYECPIHIFK